MIADASSRRSERFRFLTPSARQATRRIALLFLLSFALSVALFVVAPCIASAEEYVVRSGDTLSMIARRYNMTTQSLAQVNGIGDPNRIYVGQRLWVPWTELAVQGIPAVDYARVHQWDDRTSYFAKYYHVDPDLIRRVMWVESKGNQWARSPLGAIGLMQVMPFWFKPSENPWNSWANIGKGTYILRYGYDVYHSWYKAVAWYFYGSLARFGDNIPTYYCDLVFMR